MYQHPHWSGKYPDYIVIKPAPNVDIGDMAGEWLDRTKTRFLEIAVEMYGCKLVPIEEFEVSAEGTVAQVWLVEKTQ